MLILLKKAEHYKTWKFAVTYKMGKNVITLGNTKLKKCQLHCYKNPIF